MTDANTLEKTLATQQWVGGQTPADSDKAAYDALKSTTISAATHPNVFAWFSLVNKFSDSIRSSWTAPAPAGGAKGGKGKGDKKGGKGKKEEKPKADDDDDLDLFGDDDEEEAAAAKAAAAKAKEGATKKKKVVIAQSLVLFEIKPLDDETDLDKLAARVLAITMDGLFWKTEYKKEPVAFGIFKLIVGFSLEDEKVSVDDVVEKIEEFEDFVQSVEIAVFNKI
jgi:elongation factor 1-beta